MVPGATHTRVQVGPTPSLYDGLRPPTWAAISFQIPSMGHDALATGRARLPLDRGAVLGQLCQAGCADVARRRGVAVGVYHRLLLCGAAVAFEVLSVRLHALPARCALCSAFSDKYELYTFPREFTLQRSQYWLAPPAPAEWHRHPVLISLLG